ncbi:MAG: hypothetical protein JNN11_04655 [Candidatus Doudnabacteria bacterium]|nr:hypothetical protein [Candidatus Doudnabacteria bacterium]
MWERKPEFQNAADASFAKKVNPESSTSGSLNASESSLARVPEKLQVVDLTAEEKEVISELGGSKKFLKEFLSRESFYVFEHMLLKLVNPESLKAIEEEYAKEFNSISNFKAEGIVEAYREALNRVRFYMYVRNNSSKVQDDLKLGTQQKEIFRICFLNKEPRVRLKERALFANDSDHALMQKHFRVLSLLNEYYKNFNRQGDI